MSENSKIEWTDATWNPVVGCTKVSPGCKLCYWMPQHGRRHKAWQEGRWPDAPRQYHQPASVVQMMSDRLDQPLRWRRSRRIFVNSVSDLFHEKVPFEFIADVWATMALAERHTFQVLTKRPDRMARVVGDENFQQLVITKMGERASENQKLWERGRAIVSGFSFGLWPLRNVWLGTSVENQECADDRIPHLLRTPARVRFLSCEPLLGAVDLREVVVGPERIPYDPLRGKELPGPFCRNRIHWVIAGGESGSEARPMHPEWARGLRDQCAAANVPFFFKQWGEWLPAQILSDNRFQISTSVESPGPRKPDFFHWSDTRNVSARVGKKAAGRLLDGVLHNSFPEGEA